jgi:hypothetical protein
MKLLGGVAVICMFVTSAYAKVDVGDNVKLYKGNETTTVKVVRTKPVSDNKALLQVNGTDTEVDGLTFLVGYEEEGNGNVHYTVKWHGRDWWILSLEKGRHGLHIEYVQPGNLTKKQDLMYDETGSKAQKPGDLAAAYEKDVKGNRLAAITDFNRKNEEARIASEIVTNTQDLKHACGVDMPTKVDWQSINDETIKTLSISSFCGGPLEAMRHLCDKSNAGKKAIAKLKGLSCHFGTAMKLTVAGTSINWVFDKESPNASEYAEHELESHL